MGGWGVDMGGGIEVQFLEFGVYPGNKNLYGVYLSNLPDIERGHTRIPA